MQVNIYVRTEDAENRGNRAGNHGAIQNGSVLYETADPGLVPEAIYEADLVDVRRFSNVFGERVGLVFKIASGPHLGIELMEAAALKASPRGKLADLLRGMGGADGSLLTAHELVGRRCRIVVRHEVTKAGKAYEAITHTFCVNSINKSECNDCT